LKPDYGGDSVSEQIDDLTLAFISPLGPDYYHVFSHSFPMPPALACAVSAPNKIQNHQPQQHAGQSHQA